MEFIGLNILVELVKVADCFAGGRSTPDKDSLQRVHAGRQGVYDAHGNGSITDVGRSVDNFFIDLVTVMLHNMYWSLPELLPTIPIQIHRPQTQPVGSKPKSN